MAGHVRLALDHFDDPSIRTDDKGVTLKRDRTKPLGTELFRDSLVRVAKQREAEVVGRVEFLLPIHRISADTHSLGPEFRELAGQVTEMTALLRSARRHCFGVEEQNNWPLSHQVRQRHRVAVLVRGREVLDEITFVHTQSLVSGLAAPLFPEGFGLIQQLLAAGFCI